nr:RhoGAP [Hymenolepis microstoma]
MRRYKTEVSEKMLITAEEYVATVDRQEGVYLLSLFPKANYDVFMHTVSSVLAELVELDIGFSERTWPLRSGIALRSVRPAQSPVRLESQVSRRGRSTERGSPTSPGKENVSPFQTPHKRPSSRSQFLNRSFFKSPACSPSRKVDRSPCKTAPLKASIKHMSSFFIPTKSPPTPKEDDPPTKNFDFNICCSVADFISRSDSLQEVEGIFRKPGSTTRIAALYLRLYDHFEADANMIRTIENPQGPHEYSVEGARVSVARMLDEAPPHDITGVLIRSLAALHSNEGLLPREITELLLKATQLQYPLKDQSPDHSLDDNSDWLHRLCHARQLLAYRIILQFLLPKPERMVLFGILSALHNISLKFQDNLMSSTALARCLSNTLLGSPEEPEQMNQYIDTLINLIELSEDLDSLPQYLYLRIKDVLDGDTDISGNMKLMKRKITTDLETVMKKRSWITTAQVSLESSAPKFVIPLPVFPETNTPLCTPIRRVQTPLVANTLISMPTSGSFLRADANLKLPCHKSRARSPFRRWPKKKQQQQQSSPSPKRKLIKSKSVSRLFMDNVKTVGSKLAGL